MKTPLFFLAAIAAFFAVPFDFPQMFSVLFGAGFAAIVISDYRRVQRPLPIPLVAAGARVSRHYLRLAA